MQPIKFTHISKKHGEGNIGAQDLENEKGILKETAEKPVN